MGAVDGCSCASIVADFDDRYREAVAFLQSEPIRSLEHYAIFERSTTTAAKLSEAKTPQRKTLPFAIRQRIINALANGDSLRAIARALRVSNNTVAAIREQEWQQVATRKERIAAQCELNTTLAAERMTEKLQSTQDIPLNTLVPVFGVSADKLAVLRGHAPSVNIANIVMPTPEERSERDAAHRRLDEITALLKAAAQSRE